MTTETDVAAMAHEITVTDIDTSRLRAIYDNEGEAAFDRAARRILFATAAVIVAARGRHRLTQLINAINIAMPRRAP